MINKISEQTFNRFKTGDMQALGDIYSILFSRVKKFLMNRYKGDITVEDAEDIVQDTFIRLEDKRTEVRSCAALHKYLCKTAEHIFLNNKRSIKVKMTDSLESIIQAGIEPTTDSPEDELIMQNRSQRINRIVIKKLTERQREVLNLWIQGLGYKEIAEKLGIAVKTVETHISQSFSILRKYLSD
jgi:RNA polymerase sigma-70 factor (ECF subfamily)